MYRDFDAVKRLTDDIRGKSIHRRGICNKNGRFFDLHCRLSTQLMAGDIFVPQYCQQLGQELSGLDMKPFQEYLSLLLKSVAEPAVVGAGQVARDNQIFLVTPADDLRLFDVLRNTILTSILNNYMSKSLFGFIYS